MSLSKLQLYRVWWLFALLFAMTAFTVNTASANCKVLILGDSLSSGYGLRPGKSWVDLLGARLQPAWQTINASISGDTTQNGLQRLSPALQRHRPQIVLIELGGNDALRGTPPETIRKNIVTLVREAKKSGARVALFAIPVLPNYGRSYADKLTKLYSDISREEKITLVPCFVCAVATRPGMMQADGIHPAESAQEALLDAAWPHIGPLLKCRR